MIEADVGRDQPLLLHEAYIVAPVPKAAARLGGGVRGELIDFDRWAQEEPIDLAALRLAGKLERKRARRLALPAVGGLAKPRLARKLPRPGQRTPSALGSARPEIGPECEFERRIAEERRDSADALHAQRIAAAADVDGRLGHNGAAVSVGDGLHDRTALP